jgi:gliding motility-associated-like protein
MKVVTFLFVIFSINFSLAQNLVPNPSFENYKELQCELNRPIFPPYIDAKIWFSNILYDWVLPTDEPSQVYSTLLDIKCQANLTEFNNGYPKDGKNMVSVYLLSNYLTRPNGRSYIQTKLTEKLSRGKFYQSGGYQALTKDYCSYAANNLGMLFTKNVVETDTNLVLTSYKPQINETELNTEPLVWKRFGGCFKAEGDEQYLTIGGFYTYDQTKVVQILKGDTRGSDFASYLIDSVFVQEVKEPFIPNVITPNGDCCNEKFVLKDVDATEWSVTILNRWGQSVHQSESYKNNFTGSELSAGVYFYHVQHRECKNLTYKGSLTIIH